MAYNDLLGMWLVSRHDDICEVVKDPARFSSVGIMSAGTRPTPEMLAILSEGYPVMPSAFDSDPPAHTRFRRVLSRAFSPANVAAQEARIRRITNELVDGFVADGRVEIVERFAHPLPALVIIAMTGFPPEDLGKILRWCEDWFSFIWSALPPEAQPAVGRSIVAYQRYCAEIIAERRREPRDDLTSYLLETEVEGEALTLPELITHVGLMFITAAHQTTTNLIGNAVHVLLSQPERLRWLREDPSRIPAVIEETLRFAPAIHGLVRTATEDVSVGGVRVSKGQKLLLLYSSPNRDETVFPDPDRFDPTRDNQRHLGFGRGIHYCPGAGLARLEGRIALEVLIERLPGLRLVADRPLERMVNISVQGPRSLWVEWDPAPAEQR